MDIGIALPLPQDRLVGDIGLIRGFVQSAEDLGYAHLNVFDHVVGTDPAAVEDVSVRYTHDSAFHEPFVLLSWIAGFTSRLELVTGVLVAPQRQPVLLAKQAAELDLLSQGRLRLGVAVGANPIEYAALGVDYWRRGYLLDQHIEVMRELWLNRTVTREFQGGVLRASGINPLPVQRPIPVFVGGRSERALRRAALLGDGHVLMTLDPNPEITVQRVSQLRREFGKDGEAFGFHGFVDGVTGGPDDWVGRIERCRAAGVSTVSILVDHPALDPAARSAVSGDFIGHLTRIAEAVITARV